MLGKQLQHVIEKGDAGLDRRPAFPVDNQEQINARFFGRALNGRLAQSHSRNLSSVTIPKPSLNGAGRNRSTSLERNQIVILCSPPEPRAYNVIEAGAVLYCLSS